MFTVRLTKTAGRSVVLVSRPAAPTPFRPAPRRLLTSKAEPKAEAPKAAAESVAKEAPQAEAKPGWWSSAEFWGGLGAIAGWGMTGAAIYDASFAGPEKISLNMTSVMIVYSSLFARWAWVVKPQNLLLCSCHASNVVAQCNQMRRAIEYKLANGETEQVTELGTKAAVAGATTAGLIVAGPTLQSMLVAANLGPISTFAGAAAGPFTVHFWAPMSKWGISGASFLDLNRPTDKVSLPQVRKHTTADVAWLPVRTLATATSPPPLKPSSISTIVACSSASKTPLEPRTSSFHLCFFGKYTALTLTGAFFSRYALLVTPINYTLCSVNIALFGSSAWHLGRKLKADFVDVDK